MAKLYKKRQYQPEEPRINEARATRQLKKQVKYLKLALVLACVIILLMGVNL